MANVTGQVMYHGQADLGGMNEVFLGIGPEEASRVAVVGYNRREIGDVEFIGIYALTSERMLRKLFYGPIDEINSTDSFEITPIELQRLFYVPFDRGSNPYLTVDNIGVIIVHD